MTRGRCGAMGSWSSRSVVRCLCAFGATVSLAATSYADTPPSVWDSARDPRLRESYRVHVEVQRRLAVRTRFDVTDSLIRDAKALLERAHAESSPDVRLKFDLGAVHLLLQDYPRAAAVLRAALAAAPEHPAAEEAWLRLAYACGHVGDHACERQAYLEVLRRVTEEVARATPTLNLAETNMHLGHLQDAVEGYREALRIAGRAQLRETAPLALWGLAVALDRSGDRPAADREVLFALELQRSSGMPNLLRSTDVFFVPAYEIHWYEGLAAGARARQAKTAAEALQFWRAAEASFGAYVRAAEPARDRWLEMAKTRLAAARAERERAEKRAPRDRRDAATDAEVRL